MQRDLALTFLAGHVVDTVAAGAERPVAGAARATLYGDVDVAALVAPETAVVASDVNGASYGASQGTGGSTRGGFSHSLGTWWLLPRWPYGGRCTPPSGGAGCTRRTWRHVRTAPAGGCTVGTYNILQAHLGRGAGSICPSSRDPTWRASAPHTQVAPVSWATCPSWRSDAGRRSPEGEPLPPR